MKFQLPGKRTIMAIHRWLGLLGALFLVILSLTGLALNHAETLGLHEVRVRSSLILGRYGMDGDSDIRTFRLGESATLSFLDGQLFLDAEPFLETAEPVGIVEEDGFLVVATRRELVLLTHDYELIERLDTAQLPFDAVESVGRGAQGGAVILADGQTWIPDAGWISFVREETDFTPLPLPLAMLDKSNRERILDLYRGEGMTLYRVLLDLHSGRLFGWGGRTIMDLTAVAILLLVSSGIGGWLSPSQRNFRYVNKGR